MMNNLSAVIKATKQNWPSHRTPLYALSDVCFETPDSVSLGRIGFNNDCDCFFESGRRDATRVVNIAEVYGFSGGSIADFGVGCGRMASQFPQKSICGFDIDAVNIEWCKKNLHGGRYEQIDPFGIFPIEDSSIDLLYSHSVLTHLGEGDQFHWLKEVNRVIRGTAIISIHGLYSSSVIAGWFNLPEVQNAWFERGFKDSGFNNNDISGSAPDLYYRDVAHTPEYIYREWSQYIEVLDVICGAFESHQDAVVCRKKRNDE